MKERHSIKKFRGGNLGIIRLNHLAYPEEMIVKIGDEEFKPIGYDTYGHPVISEENFAYYKALKSIRERQGESLVPEVEYNSRPFVIKSVVYDSKEGIEEVINADPNKSSIIKELKKILIFRKQANFCKKELHTFVLYGSYALYSDGHIYMCTYEKKDNSKPDEGVLDLSEIKNFQLKEEIHLPGYEDVCAICGKHFDIDDIKDFSTTEDENCRKVHKNCFQSYIEAVNYQKASKIVDAVYDESPKSEIVKEYDEREGKQKVWYLYHTKQGDLAIRFKNKVIVIKWFGNFKPFNLETLFADEDVTKIKETDSKIIHAWSLDDAIKYMMRVKRF